MWRKICVLTIMVCAMSFASPSFAADETGQPTCSCWCGTSQGAKSLGTKTATECRDSCTQEKGTFLTCASDPSAWPINDIRCFTETQCTSPEPEGHDGVWDEGSNPNCPAEYRYCFPKPGTDEVTLGIPIGDLKTVADLEQYLTYGFQALIGFSVIITIVFTMVGGIQYVMGAASKEQVSKGKERIRHGITGLVLLLTSVLIVQTVNPQLLHLSLPRLPLVKRVVSPQGTSCEDYKFKKYELSQALGKCGDVSDVLKDPTGTEVTAGSQCMWNTCIGSSERCILTSGGAKCMSCEDVVEKNTLGIAPSPGVCSQFQYAPQVVDGKSITKHCGYTKDGAMNEGLNFKALRYGSCASYTVDCTRINLCEDYDSIKVKNRSLPANQSAADLDSVQYATDVTCGANGCGTFGIQTVCDANPCQVELNKGGCTYDDDAIIADNCIPKN